jgi:hypothetical protein
MAWENNGLVKGADLTKPLVGKNAAGTVKIELHPTGKITGANSAGLGAALTASDVSVVDATYGAEEVAVIENLRTRVDELESRLQAIGLLA